MRIEMAILVRNDQRVFKAGYVKHILLLLVDVEFPSPISVAHSLKLNKMRAPEELKFGQYGKQYIHRDKADVWCLGGMMYNVLTKQWMFEGISAKEAKVKILTGKRAPFPPEFANSADPSEQAMIKAIHMAWTYDPDDRPSAREIANYLKKHIDLSKRDANCRVSVPPLPPNYRYTDSDFMANFEN